MTIVIGCVGAVVGPLSLNQCIRAGVEQERSRVEWDKKLEEQRRMMFEASVVRSKYDNYRVVPTPKKISVRICVCVIKESLVRSS